MERKKTLGTPAQKIPFGPADEPGDGKTEYRQHSYPGNQLIGGHQAAGQQHIGADHAFANTHRPEPFSAGPTEQAHARSFKLLDTLL